MTATVPQRPDEALQTICDALFSPALRILADLDSADTETGIRRWLEIEKTDPGAQDIAGPIDALRRGIAIAHGQMIPSVGYVMGQFWRKLQDELRREL